MRVLHLRWSLRYGLSSALFAGLWLLESRAHERAKAALTQMQGEVEQRPGAGIASLMEEKARLIELDRMKSKYIADAAHELRAPITSLNLRLYLLEHATPEKRPQYLADFKRQLDRLAKLSDDLLALSRLEAEERGVQFGAVDLNKVAEDVVITYGPTAEAAGLSLILEYAPNLPPVLGEYEQLVRVGANLVANAIRYTPTGRVIVSTSLDTVNKQACIQVQDSGLGIAPQDLPRLFERFYRGERSAHLPGTGLGLSIVKEIVDLHGGQIAVESREGEGSLFRMCFPLEPSRSTAAD